MVQGSISETVTQLAEDDFFLVLDMKWVNYPAVKEGVRDVGECAHFSLSYGGVAGTSESETRCEVVGR